MSDRQEGNCAKEKCELWQNNSCAIRSIPIEINQLNETIVGLVRKGP